MGCNRVRILLQDLTKLVQRAGIVLRPQAALGQHLAKFGVGRIGSCRDPQVLGCFRKPLRTVVAHAQQCARLQAIRVGSHGGAEWGDRRAKIPLFKLRQAQIQLHPRQLWTEGKRLSISGCCFPVLMFLGEDQAQAGKRRCIARIVTCHCPPNSGGLRQSTLLLECDRFRGARGLRARPDGQEQRRSDQFHFPGVFMQSRPSADDPFRQTGFVASTQQSRASIFNSYCSSSRDRQKHTGPDAVLAGWPVSNKAPPTLRGSQDQPPRIFRSGFAGPRTKKVRRVTAPPHFGYSFGQAPRSVSWS